MQLKFVTLRISSSCIREVPNFSCTQGGGPASLSAGEIWNFLDQQLGHPATLIHAEQINSIDLSDYQVLILPSGSYSQVLDSSAIEKIGAWTGSGGPLIVSGEANNLLAGRNGFQLRTEVKPDAKVEPP